MRAVRGAECCTWAQTLPALAKFTKLVPVVGIVILICCVAFSGCGGSTVSSPQGSAQSITIGITPGSVSLQAGGTQKFAAVVSGTSNTSVTWSLASAGVAGASLSTANSLGAIDGDGNYVAPSNVSATTTLEVIGTSAASASQSAGAIVTVNASSITVAPAATTVQAGAIQAFTASTTGLNRTSVQWMVNGQVGGGSIWGTISPQGIYTAPTINPGAPVTVTASSTANLQISGNAVVSIVNPETTMLSGATYAQALASWNAVLMPRVQDRSGLAWDPSSSTWSPVPNWAPPAVGIALQVYYLEPFLRPATRLAIARQDVALMEELAEFHLALLQYRTTTIGAMLQNAPSNSIIFIDGPSNARTFAWYEPYSSTQTEIREDEQSNAQYLSTAAQLMRAIAEMPAASRTAPMTQFVQGFSGFLVSEQLLRMMYGTTPWSHYDNPNIPQPVVSGWKFLASTGYEPPDPIKYEAAMTDMELWMVSDSAEVLAADAAAPELAILDDDTRAQLQQAVLAGTSLMQARCRHTVSPDGADVIDAFPGDFDDHPYYAYAGATGPQLPAAPEPKRGVSWDIDGAYRLPIVFRSLYETSSATGASFPALNDVVALANTYVHLASSGSANLPAFNNFLDGTNSWFRVGDPSIPDGYPPDQYCDATQSPINCLTAGALQGWGQLAFANPNLAALEQNLVNLAYDDSPDTVTFKDQHYWYGGPYSANADVYPWLMIYVVGDSAERLQ